MSVGNVSIDFGSVLIPIDSERRQKLHGIAIKMQVLF